MECNSCNNVLTLDVWNRIVDTFYDKCLEYSNLLGAVDKRTCEEYLAFYYINGGLFWCEEGESITGVTTIYPSINDFDWVWPKHQTNWTVQCSWCGTMVSVEKTITYILNNIPVDNLYSLRRGKIVRLNKKKLTKILNYGTWRK